MTDVTVTADITAPADRVWSLVSDLPRMGEWSPENNGGRWLDGAGGPAVGAKFRGRNAKGLRRWSTTCVVTDATPGKRFAFEVTYGPLPISTWTYELSGDAGSTRVTESWTDRRPAWMKLASGPVMGVFDRLNYNRRGMEQTLAALKKAAETG
jgi:uncharacterized protein YndB with AHSA1/START domain